MQQDQSPRNQWHMFRFKPLSGIHRVATRSNENHRGSETEFQTPVGNSSRCNYGSYSLNLTLFLFQTPVGNSSRCNQTNYSVTLRAAEFQTPVGNSSRCNRSRRTSDGVSQTSFKPLSGIHRVATSCKRHQLRHRNWFQTPVGNSSRCNLCVEDLLDKLWLVSNPCREFIALQRIGGLIVGIVLLVSNPCREFIALQQSQQQLESVSYPKVSNPCREFIALQRFIVHPIP